MLYSSCALLAFLDSEHGKEYIDFNTMFFFNAQYSKDCTYLFDDTYIKVLSVAMNELILK